MSVTESSSTRARLRRTLFLGVLVAVLLLAGALGTMVWWARAVDDLTAREEQALVSRTIDRRLEQMSEAVTSATIWDDAWINTSPRLNMAWIDTNFGQYYAEYMGHDRTVVFDGAGALGYASSAGELLPVETAAGFANAVAPLLAEVRGAETGRTATFGFAGNVTRTRLVSADDAIWLVAASTVTPENDLRSTASAAPVVVSAREVGSEFLAGLHKDLGVISPRLLAADEAADGPVVALRDGAGRTLGRLTWTPAQPGVEVIRQVAPAFGVLLLAVFVACIVLFVSVARGFGALAANDARLALTLEDLTRARDRAEAASVAKSQFLANISHEIRTPMNGVLGMAQIMARGDLGDDQRERLQIIRESGEALLRLLNDVLDLAKIEAGKLEISRQDVALPAAIAAVCDSFRAVASEKGLAFGVLVEPDAVGLWKLDAMRISQVLGNLLSNAIKFTAEGHVSTRVWRSERGLEFAVMDTGPGIPQDRLAELFGKFNQLDASTTRQFGGTGLGLAICRELVELMDGELAVDSRVGHGSWFTFWLPAEPGRALESARVAA
ncbi:MAG: ATP-binding protein [Caulobacter sp.]|nr:ATP-binding protein [Caulobacter sp.]